MDKLYNLMNWRNIEGVVYSDIDNPSTVLGPKQVKGGNLVCTFVPDATRVSIKVDGVKKTYPMELMDDAGYYAVLLPRTVKGKYKISAEYADGLVNEYYDAYAFTPSTPIEVFKKFNAGICYDIYDYLGAHKATIDGVSGYTFAVWAPFALRVSVVGDFNAWDGRRHMMNKVEDTGVFTLFIPEVKEGELYKFEIRKKDGTLVMKADPYANASQKRPETASITSDLDGFSWNDDAWIKSRENKEPLKEPLSIYELHLGSWKKPKQQDVDPREDYYNYKELAPMIAEYVKDMGYTHIELMPIMEYPFDASWGYQVTGYYATTSRYGTPKDFMYFMDYMHKEDIGVILDWVPAHFPKDMFGLAVFDGTCLYEHENPIQANHPDWGTLIFNYGRPEVSNFLIANAFFWVKKFHIDGIRMDAVASMLYLDYGKQNSQWIPNIYGGNENLEAVEFFKHLNSQFKKQCKGALLIAEDSSAWPKITGYVEDEDGLGFDFKWNMGWMNDFLAYMQCDPYFRKNNYNQLTFSMIYQYSENFCLVFSHDEVVHGKKSMFSKMAGQTDDEKYANLRAAYAYMMTHPGKKLIFMGQDFAQRGEWNEEESLPWDCLEDERCKQVNDFVKDLNKMYKSQPALYQLDSDVDGFSWVNCVSSVNSTVSFVRQGIDEGETLLVICNFDTISYKEFIVGVPKPGKYKEILNSDDTKFGGSGLVNGRVKSSKSAAYDGRENSITISLPALSVVVLKYAGPLPTPKKKAVGIEVKGRSDVIATKSSAKSKIALALEKEIAKADAIREREEKKNIEKIIKKPVARKTVAKSGAATETAKTKTTAATEKKATTAKDTAVTGTKAMAAKKTTTVKKATPAKKTTTSEKATSTKRVTKPKTTK